jgi:hypothetical protein
MMMAEAWVNTNAMGLKAASQETSSVRYAGDVPLSSISTV